MTKSMIGFAAVLTFGAIGCGEPAAVPAPIPEWANDTRWAGRATMRSGVILEVKFTLAGTSSGYIDADPASLESHLNGVYTKGFGGAEYDSETLRIIFFISPGVTLDGVPRTCPPQFQPTYFVDADLSPTGEFHGTLTHSCSQSSIPFDEGTIVFRRF